MQSDLGKLFIGGISWDTNADRLKKYFSTYGEVLEAVIMKDRNTGRARGFGFIVFSDPAVADSVILEKHNIDGRMVEAKKAVPRDDQRTLCRNDSSVFGSPVPGRTRKIFVGGLASSVTVSDFKAYFEQFGTITDVVVMYDHNTQRPRGFGFITYESEETVDEVLSKTFHELNGKMVEVKRAVPKELSPASSRSPVSGFNYGMSRVDMLGGYNPAYSPTEIGGFGFRMDGRFSPMSGVRTGLSPFGSGYGMAVNYEPGMNASLIGNGGFSANLSYGRGLNPYIIGNNRFGNNLGYEGSNIGNNSLLNPVTRNLWGNGGLNFGAPANSRNPSAFIGSGSETIGGNTFGSGSVGWGSSQISHHGIGRANDTANRSGNIGYGVGDNNHSFGGFGRSIGTSAALNSSYGSSNVAYDGAFTDLNSGGSIYGDSTWWLANSDRDGYGSLGDGVSASSDVPIKGSPGYVGNYSIAGRQANIGPPSHGGLS